MSTYDELPAEIKEYILSYVSPVDYINMMLTSKSNLNIGKNGISNYMKNNISYRNVTLKADGWRDIRDNPLVSKFKLNSIMYINYNRNITLHISGRLFKQGDHHFLCGKYNVTMLYTMYGHYDEVSTLHLKCNFKDNKLEGLYYTNDIINNDNINTINYREYKCGVQVSDVSFNRCMMTVTLRDQFERPYKKIIYSYPKVYVNKNNLFKHYPDLNVSGDESYSESYERIELFVNNVMNGKYHEFSLVAIAN